MIRLYDNFPKPETPRVRAQLSQTTSLTCCVHSRTKNKFMFLVRVCATWKCFCPTLPTTLSLSLFLYGSPLVKVCGTPYTYIEKASPAPVVALAVKWLTGAIMSPRLCANFVLVLVRATISASPQCEAYILAAHTTQSGHTTHTHILAPPRLPRTYQRAFYALTKRILISSWSLQSRRGTAQYIYIFPIHGSPISYILLYISRVYT